MNADFASDDVVDADSHWSEPPDLFTQLAPAGFEDRLPRVEEVDGERMWVFEDNILFETDFPHPTCMYPQPLETVAEKMATLPAETQRKIMGENARELYRL